MRKEVFLIVVLVLAASTANTADRPGQVRLTYLGTAGWRE